MLAYGDVSIRQHTSSYVSIRMLTLSLPPSLISSRLFLRLSLSLSLCMHVSVHVGAHAYCMCMQNTRAYKVVVARACKHAYQDLHMEAFTHDDRHIQK